MKRLLPKIIYLSAALLMLSGISFAQEEKIIAASKIKSKITYISETDNGKGKKRSRILYDRDGNSLEFNFYDANEQLEKEKEVCVYGPNNTLINRKELDSVGNAESEFRYTYKKGLLRSEHEIQKEDREIDFTSSTFYFYDDKGQLIKEKYRQKNYGLDRKKVQHSQVIYSYDAKGNQVLRININEDGSIYNKWICVFDQNNNRLSQIVYYPKNRSKDTSQSQFKEKDKWLYTYDKNNREIEQWNYDSDGKLEEHSTTQYDEAGNEIEAISYKPDGTLSSKTITTVDAKGKELKVEAYSLNRGTYYAYFEYEYYLEN